MGGVSPTDVTRRAPRAQDTFPKLLLANAQRFGARHALREKDYGIWQTWTWSDLAAEVRTLACGLADAGFRRGDRLAIIGDNRPRLYAAMCAAQALGGVPVPMYQDSVPNELGFVVDHAEARFALAEDQEQVDKLLEAKEKSAVLETIIYDDGRGMRHYDYDFLCSYDSVMERGRRHDAAHPEFFEDEAGRGAGSDVAIILYTSGTTGNPKGVMLTHDNILVTARNAAEFDGLGPDDEILAYLPMAWVGDNIFSVGQAYAVGFCVSCPESAATVTQDLKEIGPTYFFAPPRIYETLLTNVMIRIEDAGRLKRWMFRYFMGVARRAGVRMLAGEPVGLADRLRYWLGEVLVYGPLKNTLGFSRVRIAYVAGEAIGPDIFDFYRSLGINLKQFYGQTEASVFVTMQSDGAVKRDTVGEPAPGVEIRITDDGEVVYRGPGVFKAYYKNEEATRATKTEDGWVHTGDAGLFDADGQLRIIDRAKDIGHLTDGSMFSPKYIENKLKFFPQIREVVALGHDRDYVAVMINIDLEAVGSWAERNNVSYGGYQELAAHDGVYDQIQACIEQVNRDLAADPQLAASQVRRFLVLHKELDADDGELTRTRKVRRVVIADRYRDLVEALYSDATHCAVTSKVTFEDGRVGSMRADVKIRDVPAVEPVPAPLAKAS